MSERFNAATMVKGKVRAYRVGTMFDDGMQPTSADRFDRIICSPGMQSIGKITSIPFKPLWKQKTGWCHNTVMYDWGSIVSRLLAEGDRDYRISSLYLEYKNVASPGDPVTVPSFARSGGIDYYNGLSGSADVDFIRVPLVAATRASSDTELFPDGNIVTFFAMSQGTVGIHGKAFGAGSNSTVYGGALVAAPVQADRTQDLVFSRWYFDAADQQIKLTTSQIGLEWAITLA